MLRRFSTFCFASLLALFIGIGGRSAFAAAKSGDVSVYHIENNEQQVTVKDGEGKALTSRHVATPTLKAVVSVWWDDKSASPQVSLTLEDANGLRLWNVPISIPRHFKSPGSIHCNVKSNSDTPGTELDVAFIKDESRSDTATTADKTLDAFSMVFVIGANGRPISMDAIDGTGQVHHTAMDMSAEGVTITGPDGLKAHLNTTGADGKTDSTIEINGTKITVTNVERNGKQYISFPWNGHQMLIEQGCTFTLDGDGDLIVNAPVGESKK